VFFTKTWSATDKYGNKSACVQHIFISPDAKIDFPEDRFWECSLFNSYPNILDPKPYTGDLATTGSGIPVGANGTYCQYSYNHYDDTLKACGTTFKIIRTWTVLNWCTGEIITVDDDGDDNQQIIKIIDFKKPELALPAPIILNANNQGANATLCNSTGFLPAPVISDECGGELTVRIFTSVGEAIYVNGVDGKQGGYIPTPGLKLGNHGVTYKVTDACDNVRELTVGVQVVDTKEPTVICDELTKVNLDVFGYAEVFANTFDDGSHDNCCIGDMQVKRFGQSDANFAPSVLFDCTDKQVMVVLRVFDCFGNFNECMVTALVQDKIAPTCIPPLQKVIKCTDLPPDITQSWLNGFGYATAADNCGATLVELPWQENINACGEGHILRKFTAVDSSGNISANCSQFIYVKPVSDWIIHFPPNWYGSCGEMVNAPVLTVDNHTSCDQIAVNYKDQYFGLSSDSACFKIVRTWTVINWCYYNPYLSPIKVPTSDLGAWIDDETYDNFGKYQYQQIIKVHDDKPPILSPAFDSIFCTYDSSCTEGDVILPLNINGECTNDFDIVFHIDLFNDQTFDMTGSGIFDGTLPIGKHRVLYIVEDGCGNESKITVPFFVKDCKKPTPVCFNGLIVEIMQNKEITVCAKAFNKGSYDNCPGPLIFSFSPDVSDSCRTLYCLDAYIEIPIELWVTDAFGNQDYCKSFIIVQDNMFSCDTGIPISGLIATAQGTHVSGVEVKVNSSNMNKSMSTGANGKFQFDDLDQNADYTITPFKNDNPLNGVTTFDLVMMSRHILGIEPLTSPYKIIAADINRSQSVTTFDLVELRKLILFISSDFPNNTSWRFIDKKYVFPNPANPWSHPFPEVIDLNNLKTAVANADFIAIKTGDVNGNANTGGDNFAENIQDRSGESLVLVTDERHFGWDENFTISLKAKDFIKISGFQFTFNFDNTLLALDKVVTTKLVNDENIGLSLLDEGGVTVSWNTALPVTLDDNDELLSLRFSTKSAGNLSDAISIDSRFTKAEAYKNNGMESSSEIQPVQLRFRPTEHAVNEVIGAFELFQNIPNPFSESTAIGFNLPEAGIVKFTVFDADGSVIKEMEAEFPKGFNEFLIGTKDLPTGGIYFYQLQTPFGRTTKKLTFLKK
jgi:hypothetical protein